MPKELTNLLINSGMTEIEALVYVTGLKLGPIAMAKLATKVGVSRQTAYEAVKKLQSKDLAITNQKEYGKKVYMADLEKVGDYLEKQKKNIASTKDDILKLASQFQPFAAKQPTVRFFENINALKRGWLETLETKSKKIYTIVPIDNMLAILGEEFADRYAKDKAARGVTSYSIRLDNPETDPRDHIKEKRQVRYLPPDKYDISSLFCTFDNKVMIITPKAEEIGLIIESDEISKSFLSIWKFVWEQAKEYKETNQSPK